MKTRKSISIDVSVEAVCANCGSYMEIKELSEATLDSYRVFVVPCGCHLAKPAKSYVTVKELGSIRNETIELDLELNDGSQRIIKVVPHGIHPGLFGNYLHITNPAWIRTIDIEEGKNYHKIRLGRINKVKLPDCHTWLPLRLGPLK